MPAIKSVSLSNTGNQWQMMLPDSISYNNHNLTQKIKSNTEKKKIFLQKHFIEILLGIKGKHVEANFSQHSHISWYTILDWHVPGTLVFKIKVINCISGTQLGKWFDVITNLWIYVCCFSVCLLGNKKLDRKSTHLLRGHYSTPQSLN